MFQTICKKYFTRLQRIRNKHSKIKPIKNKKKSRTKYCLECEDFTHNFRPQEAKITNKVLREKSNCVVCRSSNSVSKH